MEEVKTIIGWQVTPNLEARTLKVNQLAFICELLEEENSTGCNSVHILIKTGSIIKMNNVDDYYETDLKAYQRLIEKSMYLPYSTRLDIVFAVGQFSRRNADSRVAYLKIAKRVI